MSDKRTRVLLSGGAVGTPLFFAVVAAQLPAADGFDLGPHMISQLAAGPGGWVQAANFVVTGALFVLTAAGLGRALAEGPGRTWLPRLVAVFGAGLVAAGLMVADPVAGYPVGVPEETTWHGIGHGVAAMVAGFALVGALFVLARRHRSEGLTGMAAADVAVGVGYLVLPYVYAPEMGLLFALASAVAWGWIALAAVRLAPRPVAAAAQPA
ncbi:DUF998 domain-containing protein [Actinomadura macrotermitis]|uniref:DUF998 domain-containing protein n=1 Tax=Actinomadura macrotermitis TaxID=2585200 RepID=A0A7K0BWR5_9ACTN|nr:DUF998 domain-containing protein [Actinomadura macrotermitis]MQY05623.1 hypothetical protein [Actinomadura macrotermitis]